MTSQKFPFWNETSHCDSIFIPWNRAKEEKITFYTWKHNPDTNSYPPSPSAFPWLYNKAKKNKLYVQFLDTSNFKKQLQQTPWWIDFAEILPKMCLKDKNKNWSSLEVLHRAVTELWSRPKTPLPIGYRVKFNQPANFDSSFLGPPLLASLELFHEQKKFRWLLTLYSLVYLKDSLFEREKETPCTTALVPVQFMPKETAWWPEGFWLVVGFATSKMYYDAIRLGLRTSNNATFCQTDLGTCFTRICYASA